MNKEAETIALADRLAATILAELPGADWKVSSFGQKGERALVSYVRGMIAAGNGAGVFDGLPYSDADTIVHEMILRVGRADMVLFHLDGTATVVEVKDGNAGLMPVLQGVGQAGLYATQLSALKGVSSVRRALMWSSLGNDQEDRLVHDVCRNAGVVPLYLPTMSDMIAHEVKAAYETMQRVLREASNGAQVC